MKNNKYISILYIILAILLGTSCSKMNDLHQPYLDEGEIIYASKVDTVTVFEGYNRVLFNFGVETNTVETVRIYWNDYADSVDVPIGNEFGNFEQYINDLEENDYLFYLVSYDSYGNSSLEVEAYGSAYGESYENSLFTRNVEVTTALDCTIVDLGTAPDDNLETFVSYTNVEGDFITYNVPSSEDKFSINDAASDSKFIVNSSFCPDDGIDTLYTEYDTLTAPFYIYPNDWTIMEYSDELNSDNGAANILDGSADTRWHTNGSDYPHYATVDMGTERTIYQFGVMSTNKDVDKYDVRTPILVQFLVSNDTINWTDLGEFEIDNETADEQLLDISSTPTARYFKFVALEGDGSSNYMTLGAITAYGY